MFRIFALIAATLTVAIVSSSCQTKKYLPSEFSKKQILFGNGGGFTGMETTFILQENGQLFKANLDETYDELQVLDKETCKYFFDKLNDCNMGELEFNQPGNLYYFLEEKGKKVNKRLVWGDRSSGQPSENVFELHGELIRMVRDMNSANVKETNIPKKEQIQNKELETQPSTQPTTQPETDAEVDDQPTTAPSSQPTTKPSSNEEPNEEPNEESNEESNEDSDEKTDNK